MSMDERDERLRAAVAAARAAAAPENRPVERPKAESKDAAARSRYTGSTRGFSAASDAASAALRDAAGRRGVADHRLLTRWAEIVGERLASMCRPIRIKHRGGAALGGVLVVAARRGGATELEHESARLLERVNRFFGYAAAVELKIRQMLDLTAAEAADAEREAADRALRKERRRRPQLSKDAEARLDAITGPVGEDSLRDALRRLGENVIHRGELKRRATESPEA